MKTTVCTKHLRASEGGMRTDAKEQDAPGDGIRPLWDWLRKTGIPRSLENSPLSLPVAILLSPHVVSKHATLGPLNRAANWRMEGGQSWREN